MARIGIAISAASFLSWTSDNFGESVHMVDHSVEHLVGSLNHLLGLLEEHFLWLLSDVGAVEDGWWQHLGVVNGVAGIANGTSFAPGAFVIGHAVSLSISIAHFLIILDNWLLRELGALEDSWWEDLGVLDGVASWSDSTGIAP